MNSGLSGDFIFLVKSPLANVLLIERHRAWDKVVPRPVLLSYSPPAAHRLCITADVMEGRPWTAGSPTQDKEWYYAE